jgi:hypothetical protein
MPDMNLAVPPPAAAPNPPRALAGVDFTSAPRRGKPIVWAWGAWQRPGLLKLERFEDDLSADAFAASLRRPRSTCLSACRANCSPPSAGPPTGPAA